jgi:hypothetical protein
MYRSAREGGLNDLLSLCVAYCEVFGMSLRASFFLDHLGRNRSDLHCEKIFLGGSRLAATLGLNDDGNKLSRRMYTVRF